MYGCGMRALKVYRHTRGPRCGVAPDVAVGRTTPAVLYCFYVNHGPPCRRGTCHMSPVLRGSPHLSLTVYIHTYIYSQAERQKTDQGEGGRDGKISKKE